MPSPVGHTMLNLSIYLWVKERLPRGLRFCIFFCILGLLSDFDILFIVFGAGLEVHRGATHSGIFALTAAFIFSLFFRKYLPWKRVFTFFLMLTLGHLFLDYITLDDMPPPGIQFFWPFSNTAYDSPYHVFGGFDWETPAGLFSFATFKSIFGEFIIMLPIFLLVLMIKFRRNRTNKEVVYD